MHVHPELELIDLQITDTTTIVNTVTETPSPATVTETETFTPTQVSSPTFKLCFTANHSLKQINVIPTATVYAACADEYMVNKVNGQAIGTYYDPKNKIWANTDDSAAYDCCVSCIKSPICAAAAFDAWLPAGKQCLIDVKGSGETCPAYNPAVVLDDDLESSMTVMNGQCGGFKRAL